MNDRIDYAHIFERIAAKNHTTVTEVRREIEIAIRAGFESPDPLIQAQWAKIPRTGDVPTADELIQYMVRQMK